MSRKIAVVAMAISAAVILTLPGSASAIWGHHLETLPNDVQLGIAGAIKLETGAGGVECRFPIRARLIAGTSRGQATAALPQANGTTSCKGLGSYALCQVHDLSPRKTDWAFHNTWVQSKELIYDGDQVTVETGLPEEAIQVRSRRVSARPKGVFCPVELLTITPGAIAALPEGGPDTIANVVLNGILAADAQTKSNLSLSGRMTVSGTLQIADPAQRDTYSIGNDGS